MIKEIIRDQFFLSRPSSEATKDDLPLASDLADTLAANASICAGLAANMIGVSKRAIAVSVGGTPVVMFNPVIVGRGGRFETEEGCLSLDGQRPSVRYHTIEVEYIDESWKKRRKRYSGWTAQIIQHEIDHCCGILI